MLCNNLLLWFLQQAAAGGVLIMKRIIVFFISMSCVSTGVLLLAFARGGGSEVKRGIGVLVRNVPLGINNPSEYMLEDGYLYRGAAYRISDTNIVYTGKNDIADLEGALVVYTYTREMSMAAIIEKMQPAPKGYGERESMQSLRSDWTAPETGFSIGRSTRERLGTIPYFVVYAIDLFEGLTVQRKDSQVEKRFNNTLGYVVDDVRLFARYESSHGRPLSRVTYTNAGSLNSGESFDAVFPLQFEEEQRVFSLHVVGAALSIAGQPSRFEVAVPQAN